MCSELTSVSYAVESLTGMSGLAATIVQVIITMIYSGQLLQGSALTVLIIYAIYSCRRFPNFAHHGQCTRHDDFRSAHHLQRGYRYPSYYRMLLDTVISELH